MPKDLKIGMILGLIVLLAAALWFATRPSLSTRGRMPQFEDVLPEPASSGSPNDLSANRAIAEDSPPEPPDLTRYEKSEKIKTQKFHYVQRGESLSSISRQYYGSANKWQKIYEANRQTIKNPDKLIAGTKLIIPD